MTRLRENRQKAPLTIEGLSEKSSVALGVEPREPEIPAFGAEGGDRRRYRAKKEG